MSHTPGPWTVEDETSERLRVVGSYENTVADCVDGHYNDEGDFIRSGDCEANARLIAAAPAMLDALYLLSHICRNMKAENENHRPSEAAYQVAMRCASAVISKATGEEA